MNILTDKLPDLVNIGGKMYPVDTDFRAGIAFEIMIEEGKKNLLEAVSCFFHGKIPNEDVISVIDAVISFYICGTEKAGKEKPTHHRQGYSFKADSSVIFADFWNYYNIDLTQAKLHWWVFRQLLDGLPESSEFKQRVYYRTCDTHGLSKNERKRIMKIRNSIEIKKADSEKMTLEERNAKMREYITKRAQGIGGGDNG